jgi:hypothetical protein
MTTTQKTALDKLLSLRKITVETSTVTRRSQNRVLQSLNEEDLIVVSLELAHHQEQYGW